MRKLIKASTLAKNLGISRYTVRDWCQNQPGLAVKKGRDWYIRIQRLAERDGLDPVKVHTMLEERWVKAIRLAKESELPRRTIAYWCKNRPNFGMRIGRIWYVNPSMLGATDEQVDILRRLVPDRKSVIRFAESTSDVGNYDE